MKKAILESAIFIIPAIRTMGELVDVLEHYSNPYIMIKLGDVNTLPHMVKKIHEKQKKVIVHQDSISGLNYDRTSIHYLSNIGVDAVNTTKSHCINVIHEEKMLSILGLFMIDSSAIKTGIRAIKETKPDYALLMPSCLPHPIIQKIMAQTAVPLLGGGLCSTKQDVAYLTQLGFKAVTSSEHSLWDKKEVVHE